MAPKPLKNLQTIGDDRTMKGPEPMQEVHEWRRKIYEESKHLSHKEFIKKVRREAEEVAPRAGH